MNSYKTVDVVYLLFKTGELRQWLRLLLSMLHFIYRVKLNNYAHCSMLKTTIPVNVTVHTASLIVNISLA